MRYACLARKTGTCHGENRAEAVKTFLVGLGVPGDKISTSSRGKLDAVGQDEAGWSQDRRVDLEVR